MLSNNINAQFDYSIEELQTAAADNNVRSQSKLGFKYKEGDGVEKDLNKAFYWLLKAAQQNDFKAINAVALMYCDGIGTERDLKKGFYWINKVDNGSNPKAFFLLGNMYFNGLGTNKDYKKAFDQYKRAADLGYIFGIDSLIHLYQNGIGTPKDLEKVTYWEQRKITLEKQGKESQERLARYESHRIECEQILKDINEENENITIVNNKLEKLTNQIASIKQSIHESEKVLMQEYGAYKDGKGVLHIKENSPNNNFTYYWNYRDVISNDKQLRSNLTDAVSDYNYSYKSNDDRVEINKKKSDDYNKDCR